MKAKTFFIATFIFLQGQFMFSQNDLKVLHTEEILGKNLMNETDIIGTVYTFPARIHLFSLDTKANMLTIQLRGLMGKKEKLNKTGTILQYDMEFKNVLWSSNVVYKIDRPEQWGNFLIKNGYSIDINTGKHLWVVKHDIYWVDSKKNICIGYKKNSNFTSYANVLEGVDIKNGKILWKREIDRKYGWSDLFYMNDSTLIVVASGIHEVNIYTGKGWDYHAITATTESKNTLYIGGGLASNVLVDRNSIYFASTEQIVKLDKQFGNIEWKNRFIDSRLTSSSSIFMDESLVYMVNKGFVSTIFGKFDVGSVFFAAFDKQTGEQKYLSLINSDNRPIKDFKLLGNEIYILIQNKIVKCNMVTGIQTFEKELPRENLGVLRFFTGSHLFINNQNGDFYNLLQNDSKKLYLYTTKNLIVSLDNQLNVTNTIDSDDVGIYYLRFMDYRFIAKKEKTFIINKEGSIVAELEISSNAFLVDDILYDKKDKRFIAIDLKKVF